MKDYHEQRAEFAAHAPDVPDWYSIELHGTAPELPRADKVLSRNAYATFEGFVTASADSDRAEIDAYNALFFKAEKARRQWETANHMRRLVAWRWAYADAMMEGFGK